MRGEVEVEVEVEVKAEAETKTEVEDKTVQRPTSIVCRPSSNAQPIT